MPKNILISVSLLPDKHVQFNLLWHRQSNMRVSVLAMEEAACGCWSRALLIADTKNKSGLSPRTLPYPSVSAGTGTLYPLTSKHRGEAMCKGKWSDGTEPLTSWWGLEKVCRFILWDHECLLKRSSPSGTKEFRPKFLSY